MQHDDLDAPNLGTVREPHGRSHLFLEDDPPMGVEDDAFMSVPPSVTKRPSRAAAVFLFLFVVVVGTGGAFAWSYYGEQAMDMIRTWALPGATSKPTARPEGFAEFRQQLKSMADDLAAVRHALEQQSTANHDQLARIQEQNCPTKHHPAGNQTGADLKAFVFTSHRQASPRTDAKTCVTPGTLFNPGFVQADTNFTATIPITTKTVIFCDSLQILRASSLLSNLAAEHRSLIVKPPEGVTTDGLALFGANRSPVSSADPGRTPKSPERW